MTPRGSRPPAKLAECKECAAPIVFAQLDTGKAIPLNPIPVDPSDGRGNVIVRKVGGRLTGWVESRAHPWEPGFFRMIPHHATCEERQRRAKRAPDPALF